VFPSKRVGPYDFRSLLFQYTIDVKNLLAQPIAITDPPKTDANRSDRFNPSVTVHRVAKTNALQTT